MKLPIHITVHPVVHEFFVCKWGADTHELKTGDKLTKDIRYILQLNPKINSKPKFNDGKTLTLLLPSQIKFCKNGVIDTKHGRNYLDENKQNLISNELLRRFKEIFHTHVNAFCRAHIKILGWKKGMQKMAIEDFCKFYNLKMDNINFEMLKKSWDRSEEKIQLYSKKSGQKLLTTRP